MPSPGRAAADVREEATMSAAKPPFRADHVGSLLRPAELQQARARAARGEIDRAALRAVEDRSIRGAVLLQESVGLQSITDGEFRRDWWHIDFLRGFDGVETSTRSFGVKFEGAGEQPPLMRGTGKLRRTKLGDDPDRLPATYADAVNAVLRDVPRDVTVAIHTCRGNFKSTWMASGGYDPVAEAVFTRLNVNAFFLEYDTGRAGGFEPLRFVPQGKKVVLGLINSKVPELEKKDDLKRRIEVAAKYVPLENLCLSPQCGFSSTHHGNKITVDDQRRKLALALEVAHDVWGSA